MPTSEPPLQWELPIDKPTYAHYKSRSELQQSAGEKCYICVRILEWMNPIEAEEVSDRELAAEVLDGRAPIESNRIEFLEIRFNIIESNLYKSSIRSNIR
jgi:hypothetical protein